jgi:drug/metabolite transporter (DMT)-like permease
VGSLVARDGERPASAVQATAMQLLSGAVVVALVGALSPESAHRAAARLTPRAAGSLVFLVVCGTALGMASYTWLMRVASPAAVGTYAFVNPVIALLLGRAVGDDQLGPRSLVAAALVVTGVVLIQRAAARPRATSRSSDGKAEAIGSASQIPAPPAQLRRMTSLDTAPARLWVRSEG